MELNSDQRQAVSLLTAFYKDPMKKFFVILGAGGTGKSALIANFIFNSPELVKAVTLTAPTNKAVEVLHEFSETMGDTKIDCATIYSLLGLVLGKDGEVKRTFSAHDGRFDNFYTIVIDEGSMSGEQLTDKIEDRADNRRNVKVIVMADPCQLNPINETHSRLLDLGESFELTEDMRSGNGGLLQTKRMVRDFVQERIAGNKNLNLKLDLSSNLDEDGSGLHFLPGKAFDDAMLDMFGSDEYAADSRFCRALAWENKEVDRLNRIIRARIYGKNVAPYMLEERVAVLTPVMDEDGETAFSTDSEAVMVDIQEAVWTDYYDNDSQDTDYKVFRITLTDGENTEIVPVIHPDSKGKLERRCNFLYELCLDKKMPWAKYWDFKDFFITLRPIHATTVHKSQGQTFGCTFLNLKNVMKNKNVVERSRLGYVGMSRSTTDLVVNLKTFY